jgi:hypothetical protein
MLDTEDPRGRAGVACSLVQSEGGSLRLFLDDLELTPTSPRSWSHRSFVTFKDYPGGVAELESLSDTELADFGHYVLTRLLACHEQYGTKR